MATVDVFNCLPDAVCIVDIAGNIQRHNAAFRRLVNHRNSSSVENLPNFLDEVIFKEFKHLFIDVFDSISKDVRDNHAFEIGQVKIRQLGNANPISKIAIVFFLG